MTETRFRQILVLYAVCSIAAIVAAFLPGGYSQAASDAFANEPEPWLVRNFWLFLGISIPLLCVAVAGFIGLFMFKAWGRTVSLYTTLAGLGLLLLLGPTLSSALEGVLWEAANLLWGSALALAYFSPIAGRFGR